jgi:hypothetical protein
MIVEDVELRARPGFHGDSLACDHVWEPHLPDTGRAYCPRCGSFARWVNDPRAADEEAS